MSATRHWRDWSCQVVVTTAIPDEVDRGAELVRGVMHEVARSANRFTADSDISRINAASGRLVPVCGLTLKLVEIAVELARSSRGFVDPLVGGALLALGYDRDLTEVRARAVRGTAPIAVVERSPAWEAVVIDPVLSRVGVPRGTALDLGASAKAWAVDEAADRLSHGLAGGAVVSIGGDLAVRGVIEGGWQIAVSEAENSPGEVVTLDRGALATSSTIGRTWAGRHHIIDPRTGTPAVDHWRTATVWAPTAVQANLLSTWALIDASSAEAELMDRGLAARLVDHSAQIHRVGPWPAPQLAAEVATC